MPSENKSNTDTLYSAKNSFHEDKEAREHARNAICGRKKPQDNIFSL
jgi:hypothetical protein